MTPIRILQVFARMDRGGAETMIMNHYRLINRNKLQFDFLVHTNDKCAFDDEIKSLGGRIFRMPKYTLRTHFNYISQFRKFLNIHPEYLIIHGHYFTISPIYFSAAKKENRICIAHAHSTLTDRSIKARLINLQLKTINYFTDVKLACSKIAGESVFGKGRNDIIIFKNAIDINKFVFNENVRIKCRDEFNLKNKFVIGHIGRFFDQKNHTFLVDIFKEVLKKKENAILLLVGDGVLRTQIEDKVKQLGLSNKVIFTGVRSDIPDLLQVMDVFVFPSHYEGLGIVLIEAQTSGLKCFASSEAIPKEAKVTDLLEFISLNEPPEYWANEIIKSNSEFKRKSMEVSIKNAGYDVKDNAIWLEEFYLSLNNSL